MHLSPIKGAFPHKDQHDHTAPVAVGQTTQANKNIERGNVICLDDDGNFTLAKAADAGKKPLFLALQPYSDMQAAMAGSFSYGGYAAKNSPAFPGGAGVAAGSGIGGLRPGVRIPAITGIHMDDGDVWEVDMYVDIDENAKIGAPLTVSDDGRITVAAEGDGVIGFLVKKPDVRYVNDAPAIDGLMTGANLSVIQFQCGL